MNTEKAQRMFALIDQWRASGQRRDEFCRQHQIKVSTLSYWVTRKNRADREQPGGFIRIESAGSPSSSDPVELIYPNGVRLRIGGVNRSVISTLIRAW
ncbi:MAG: hypothetical protein WD097_04410 [Balneolales bacterium]